MNGDGEAIWFNFAYMISPLSLSSVSPLPLSLLFSLSSSSSLPPGLGGSEYVNNSGNKYEI